MAGIPWHFYVLAVAFVLGPVLLFYKARDESQREAVKLLAILLGFVVAFFQMKAMMLQVEGTMLQVRNAALEAQSNVRHQRMDVSFHLVEKWNEQAITEADSVFEPLVDSASGKAAAQIQPLFKDPRNSKAFITIFAFFEGMGL